MQARKGQWGLIFVILIVILIIAFILLAVYLWGGDPVDDSKVNETVNKTYYNVTLGANIQYLVSYELKNSTHSLVRGSLHPDALENYRGGIEANTTVRLSAWGDNYYFNETICNITRNDFPCKVGLKEKSLNYSINFSETQLVIEPYNKTIQTPQICFSEKANVRNVILHGLNGSKDGKFALPPKNLERLFDFCYVFNYDFNKKTVFGVEIHKNPFMNVSGNLSLLVRDVEKSGLNNIGDRNSSVFVR